ncbi:NAD(P)H-dependent oxidoreductase [Phytomonospora sp. NPDC050363]|uniref:FMN-dependent NADH-azoreductase n=1 Tax=Phytomonospora sp. NPDC050363 TaxID=3155642 RepID=UPI0033F60711
MATLLHVDSSINGANSWSKKVTATFAEEWRKANPEGEYIYRDLGAEPIEHLTAEAYAALNTDPAEHTPEQAEHWKVSGRVHAEVDAADVILLGVPMYNFSIPSTLKSWMDRIATQKYAADADGRSPLSDKKLIVATARGGSYAPGTPRASFEHQEPYLRSFFTFLGLTDDVHFLNTEMTLSHVVPALEQFKHVFDATSEQAHSRARELATAAA